MSAGPRWTRNLHWAAVVTYTGPHIILDAVTYRTLGCGGAGRIVTVREVAYLFLMYPLLQ
ncbi:hypothetical protein AEGHOMDF_0383 [Methylobacterium soli]|nr:hypothetical protein AEGHOMDF_0383 [Methylobacterium soli]